MKDDLPSMPQSQNYDALPKKPGEQPSTSGRSWDHLPAVQSSLLLAVAFTFAFLLGEMAHEYGHFLAHQAYGTSGITVHLDPFGGSHIEGAAPAPDLEGAVTSAAGPLLNLFLGGVSFFLLWRYRRPRLLPLLLWGPIALVQEGVTFSLGLLTPGGDAQWIASAGIPQGLILLLGMAFLAGGLAGVARLLPLAGIGPKNSYWGTFFIILVGMCTLMLVRSVQAFFVSVSAARENIIPLFFSVLLAFIVAGLHRPVARWGGRDALSISALNARKALALSLVLAALIFTAHWLAP